MKFLYRRKLVEKWKSLYYVKLCCTFIFAYFQLHWFPLGNFNFFFQFQLKNYIKTENRPTTKITKKVKISLRNNYLYFLARLRRNFNARPFRPKIINKLYKLMERRTQMTTKNSESTLCYKKFTLFGDFLNFIRAWIEIKLHWEGVWGVGDFL